MPVQKLKVAIIPLDLTFILKKYIPLDLTLLWACNPLRGDSKNWRVSQVETGKIISKSIRVLI